MDADGRLREDVISPLLKVSTYKGFTLTGPREAIVRKVYANQVVTPQTPADGTGAGGESSFTQLNFRCLGTSSSSMLNARVRLVVPLRFYAPSTNDAANATNHAVGASSFDEAVVGPRRNGLLKAFSSISTIINNTTSFSVRPDECLAPAEQCFTQIGELGMTGVNNEEESGWWGPDWDGSGAISSTVVGGPSRPYGGLSELGFWEVHNLGSKINIAAAHRRQDWLQGSNTLGYAMVAGAQAQRRYIDYEYRSDLFIPPFKMFDYPTVSKAPTYLPFSRLLLFCTACEPQ